MLVLANITENTVLENAHISDVLNLVEGCNHDTIHVKFVIETENYIKEIKMDRLFTNIKKHLNDDCILSIIQYLDLKQLIKMALFSKRFLLLIQYGYKNVKVSINLKNKTSEICRLTYLLGYLRLGRTIRSLHLTFEDTNSLCCRLETLRMVKLVMDQIGFQIKEIIITASDIDNDERMWLTTAINVHRFLTTKIKLNSN